MEIPDGHLHPYANSVPQPEVRASRVELRVPRQQLRQADPLGLLGQPTAVITSPKSILSSNHEQREGVPSRVGRLIFTVKEGAQQPDLAADPGTCPTQNTTIEITGTLPVWNSDDWKNCGRKICGLIAPSPPPANPCAARIDKTAASSISAQFTASVCLESPPIVTSNCPPPRNRDEETSAPGCNPGHGGIRGLGG